MNRGSRPCIGAAIRGGSFRAAAFCERLLLFVAEEVEEQREQQLQSPSGDDPQYPPVVG